MPHRIIVIEAAGNVFATGEPRPCLYAGIQTAASFDETIPTEILPTWLQDSEPVPRFDFMPTTTFQTRKRAKAKLQKIRKRLTRMRYAVQGQQFADPTTYSLYVIELAPGPEHEEGTLPPLYVGQTCKSIEERFREHLDGGRTASRKVTGRAVGLRTDLIPDRRFFYVREDAEKAETRLGVSLQKRGHRVYGPQNMPTDS